MLCEPSGSRNAGRMYVWDDPDKRFVPYLSYRRFRFLREAVLPSR